MCVRPYRDPKCSGQPKISKFYVSLCVNEQILWLQISVQNTMGMAVSYSKQKLMHIALQQIFDMMTSKYFVKHFESDG